MARIYSYRNGDKAYYEDNKKMLITDEEYNDLYMDDDTLTLLHNAIVNHLSSSKYVAPKFSDVVKEYHAGSYRNEFIERELCGENKKIEILYKADEAIAFRIYGYYSDGSAFDSTTADDSFSENLNWLIG